VLQVWPCQLRHLTPRPPPPDRPAPASHVAMEYPCNVFFSGGRLSHSKWSNRVCLPESMSIFRVLSSAHVMFNRPGRRMLPPAPYTRQGSVEAAVAGAPPPRPPAAPARRPPRTTRHRHQRRRAVHRNEGNPGTCAQCNLPLPRYPQPVSPRRRPGAFGWSTHLSSTTLSCSSQPGPTGSTRNRRSTGSRSSPATATLSCTTLCKQGMWDGDDQGHYRQKRQWQPE
jgi:hypothetical protein